jgi:threonine dehydrogenase-like Zn-dependent dehydrogenase
VLLGLALGAARVVAAGRNAAALDALANAAGRRVVPVRLSGDLQADVASLRAAAGGGAEIVFDMVGQAQDANATLAALHNRLVLMGSMTTPLPLPYGEIMRNNWEIIGQFMYPSHAYRSLLGLLRAGLLDISAIRPRRFPLLSSVSLASPAPAVPVLFGLAADRRRRRVLDLQPVVDSARAVGEPRRFETMPSQPSVHACLKMIASPPA